MYSTAMDHPGRESENQAVYRALTSSYCPEPIRQARERQDEILKERFEGRPYAIADVGCGTGYHGLIFGPGCRVYHGFEIAPEIAEVARAAWREKGLENAEVFLGDVGAATLEDDFYDLVFCLYFTPGNIREESDDLSVYTDAYLDQNPKFVATFANFYKAMKVSGKMFLTVYKDVPEAEAAQIDFYHHTDQRVVTPPGSRFVCTAEKFWSVRFTRASMLSNLRAMGIHPDDVLFNDLNAIAWLVEISKQRPSPV